VQGIECTKNLMKWGGEPRRCKRRFNMQGIK